MLSTCCHLYDGALLIAETNGSGKITRTYTWGAQGLISDQTNGGSSEFYLYDASASTRTLIGGGGQVLWQCGYSAWGTPIFTFGSSGGGGAQPNSVGGGDGDGGGAQPNRVQGPPPPQPLPVYTGPTPFAWNGRVGNYTDAETGLTLIGARYYAPGIARFLSRDPSGYSGGTNVYAYCAGDPIDFCDPDGQCPVIIVTTVGGALLGGGLDGWLAYRAGARGAALWSAIGRGAFVGAAAGAASGVLGPEAGLGVWGAMGGGALGGAAGNLAGQAFDNATGRQHGLNLKSVAKDAIIGGILHPAGPFLQKVICFAAGPPVQVAPQVASLGSTPAALSAAYPLVTASAKSAESAKANKKTTANRHLSLSAKIDKIAKLAEPTKPIEQIKVGDLVASRDQETGQTQFKRVTQVFKHTSDHLLTVALADKKGGKVVETFQTTRQHPFYVEGEGWVPAGGLAIGNRQWGRDARRAAADRQVAESAAPRGRLHCLQP